MSKLAELGRLVAEEQDVAYAHRPRDERDVDRFVRSVRQEPLRARRRNRLAAGAFAAAAAVALVGFIRWNATTTAGRDDLVAASSVGQPFVARDGKTVPLNFPDGSHVVLASGTEAVVHQLSDQGARLEVSRGSAAIAVRHQPNTSWLVGAGPYQVRVTGTRFSVAWAPERERFELRLDQGSVVVSNDASSHAAVTMIAPETLVIDRGNWQLLTANAVNTQAPQPPTLPPPATPEAASAESPSAVPTAPASPSTPSWEVLVRAGKYQPAYTEAARHGIAQLSDSRPSNSLLSLAEVCRFSGHPNEATQVLNRLRARFPRSDDAATAAFQLGRNAPDAVAVNWFRTYLQERPNGALAREASGRLLEALSRSGDRAGAQRAAETYLSRYPTGTHAAFARQLLGR